MTRVRSCLFGVMPYVLVCAVSFLALRAFPPLKVTGRSMYPALERGDIVVVDPRSSAREGDIALVRRFGHGPILHRVISVSGGELVTKGDANRTADVDQVSADEVGGVVVCVIPFGKAARWWRANVVMRYTLGSIEQQERVDGEALLQPVPVVQRGVRELRRPHDRRQRRFTPRAAT